MSRKKNVTLRVDRSWQTDLDAVLNRVAHRKRGAQSRMIRQFVAKDTKLWLRSPYYVAHAKIFAIVTKNGELLFRSIEQLRLNAHRKKLPTSFEMKPEKREYFCQKYHGEPNEAELIRAHWLVNHCAIWEGTDTDADPIATATDRLGVCSKSVDMRVDARNDSTLTREIMVVFDDYVQRRSHAAEKQVLADDRVDIEIKLPTKELDVQCLVDCELYPTGSTERSDADLGYEFRNGENALFPSREVDPDIDWVYDRFPHTMHEQATYKPTIEAITESFASFQGRLQALSKDDYRMSDGQILIESEGTRTRLRSLELPKSYLFGRLKWPIPYQGLSLCVTWNMPD